MPPTSLFNLYPGELLEVMVMEGDNPLMSDQAGKVLLTIDDDHPMLSIEWDPNLSKWKIEETITKGN